MVHLAVGRESLRWPRKCRESHEQRTRCAMDCCNDASEACRVSNVDSLQYAPSVACYCLPGERVRESAGLSGQIDGSPAQPKGGSVCISSVDGRVSLRATPAQR